MLQPQQPPTLTSASHRSGKQHEWQQQWRVLELSIPRAALSHACRAASRWTTRRSAAMASKRVMPLMSSSSSR